MANKYDESSIKVNRADRDKVRQSPTMYVPSLGLEGSMQLWGEAVFNALDELTIDDPVGNNLTTTFDMSTKEMTVVDDGRGIPLGSLYDLLTVVSASGKFNNDETTAYTASGGVMGTGAKLITYLSKHAKVTSMRDGKFLTYEFVDGLLKNKAEGKSKDHGTIYEFTIDQKYLDVNAIKPDHIKSMLKEVSYLFPTVNIKFIVLNKGKEIKTYTFGGKTIVDWLEDKKPDTSILHIVDKRSVTYLKNLNDDKPTTSKISIDIALAFKEDVLDKGPDDYILCYANSIKNYLGGTHLDGCKDGIVKWFKNVVIPGFKGKDKDLQILPSDMTAGLVAFITIRASHVVFRAQHKDRLENPEIKFAVRDAVYEALCKAKPSVTNPMIDFVKRVARGRLASKKTRKKDVGNAFSKDRLDKFIDITYNMDTVSPELVLCEGDSAQNCASTARDPHNQALYCVKKPANIYDDDSESVAKTVTVFNEILDICGLEPGKKCDPEKSTMKRILMLTDGDVDGDSIAISVMCLLAKHCKPLIDAGMVGRILPPAYAIPTGKNGKRVFVHTQREFFNTIMKKFVKEVTVAYKGKELSKQELYDLLSKNFVYDTKLQKLADRYCCDPKFMEYIAWKYHGDETTQKKSYWMNALKPFEDIHIYMEHSMIIIDGDLKGYDHINLSFDEYFNRHVNRFKKHQSANNDIYNFSINGEKDKSLYDVMKAMRKYIPNDVQRFKGLGELEPWEMKEFCMDRDHRNVVIMKFKDYDSDMEKLNVIMSTKQAYVDARSRILRGISMSDLDLDT